MAERRRQPKLRCHNQYVSDRLASQKISQVYHWLVPEMEAGSSEKSDELTKATNEKERSHLRPSFL